MKLGDMLELLGLLCLCAGAYLYFGLPAAVVALGATLIYEGQCFGATPLPTRPKRTSSPD